MFDRGCILEPSKIVRCDDARVGGPVVRWNADKNRWYLWYYARSQRFAAGLAPAFGTGAIALADSEDGTQFTRVEGKGREAAIFEPASGSTEADSAAFDARHVGTGDLLHWRGAWWMAYFGGNDEAPKDCAPLYAERGYVLRIGLAVSTDGVSWNRVGAGAIAGPEGDEVYAGFPGLVDDGERLTLHYTVVDRQGRYYRTRMLSSMDGKEWRRTPEPFFEGEPPLHETGGVITRDIVPSPLPEVGRWWMVYTARDGRSETGERRSIGVAVSDDLIRWRRLWREPVFTPGIRGAWDSAGVANPRLVITEREYRLYYYGWSNDSCLEHPRRGIGLAIASRDHGVEGLRMRRRVEGSL
ncbi:MAG: hypothetical protein ACO3OV_10810 [Steroidobacteraceae bacterium]